MCVSACHYHGWQADIGRLCTWCLGYSCDAGAGMNGLSSESIEAVHGGSVCAKLPEYGYACGFAEQLCPCSSRLDKPSALQLQHHGQMGLKVADMGHLPEQPPKQAMIACCWGQPCQDLALQEIHLVVRVHADHTQVGRSLPWSCKADSGVGELLVGQ